MGGLIQQFNNSGYNNSTIQQFNNSTIQALLTVAAIMNTGASQPGGPRGPADKLGVAQS